MLIAEIDARNVGAPREADRAIAYFCSGVANFARVVGGAENVPLGDVVAATKMLGHKCGKDRGTEITVRPGVGKSAYQL